MPSVPPGSFSKPELLSPAGNWESLKAAVANGADAVYLGVTDLNARINARNFSIEELVAAVRYSHDNGVRVYLTLNILIKNHEIGRFFNILSRAYAAGIDGVIIQHISFLEIIRKNYPGLAVIISTQAAIGNTSSAALVKSADRVVLPRELSLAEIRQIVDSGVKAEVFVHGALCFSYSGLCLLSSFVSGRSGNRGSCAQLCRQKYNGCYPLSTRELCLGRRVPELMEAGVKGFKIEGRMRSALYVAVATRLYRKAIDSYLAGSFVVPEKEMDEIEVVFNRKFTEGFAFGDTRPISPEKPMNRGAFLGVIENGKVLLRRSVATGDGVGIWTENGVAGAVIKQIVAGGERLASASAGRMADLGIGAAEGFRIFLTSSPRITAAPDSALCRTPIAAGKRRQIEPVLPEAPPKREQGLKLLVKAYSLAEARESLQAGASFVFYDIFAADFPHGGEKGFGAYLPRILSEDELRHALRLIREYAPPAVLAGNPGILAHRAQLKVPLYLDYSINCFNDQDVRFFKRNDATPLLSPELSLAEMAQFKDKDVVMLCHGDVALVNTKIRLDGKRLADEKGLVFPVRTEGGYWQVLNGHPFGVFNDILRLRDAGFSQFLIDKQGEGGYFTSLYRAVLNGGAVERRKRKGYTAGHLYRQWTEFTG